MNPGATSREWEEPEHEILALLIESVRESLSSKINGSLEEIKENREDLSQHGAMLMRHEQWIGQREAVEAGEEEWETNWFRSWRFRLEVLMLIIAVASALTAMFASGII